MGKIVWNGAVSHSTFQFYHERIKLLLRKEKPTPFLWAFLTHRRPTELNGHKTEFVLPENVSFVIL